MFALSEAYKGSQSVLEGLFRRSFVEGGAVRQIKIITELGAFEEGEKGESVARFSESGFS